MGRIIEARGPVVSALKRYDPGLRVRWSHEQKCWVVDAPLKLPNPNWVAKPVRFERIEGTDNYIERLLPEYSERNIQYKDKRYVVCKTKKVDWPLLRAIRRGDSHLYKHGASDILRQQLKHEQERKSKEDAAKRDERVREAYDKVRFIARTNPNLEDGAGTSSRNMPGG